MSPGRRAPLWTVVGLTTICIALLIRFVHLSADFPVGITTSGVLYTDEGWFANAAVRQLRSGSWYQAGDLNPVISMPFGQLVHWVCLRVFGLSLASVRITPTCAFVVLVAFAGLMLYRRYGGLGATLVALILSTHYVGFAYSRLAVMEPLGMTLVAASIYFATLAAERHARRRLIAASVLASLACLTKASMAFCVPVICYLALASGRTARQRAGDLCLPLIIVGVWVGGYQLLARHFFAVEYTYFNHVTLTERQVTSLSGLAVNAVRQLFLTRCLGVPFLFVTATLTGAASMASSRFRRDPLVRALFLYVAMYYLTRFGINYGAPRYFLPLLFPFAALSAIACCELVPYLRRQFANRAWSYLPVLLVVGLSILHSISIGRYLAHPQYSMLTMLRGVPRVIAKRDGQVDGAVVLGKIGDTLALESGVRAMNPRFATLPLEIRLNSQKPAYALLQDDTEEVTALLHARGASTQKLQSWDVYANYYGKGEPVTLYAIGWPQQP